MSTDIIMPESRRQVAAPAAMDTSIMAVISRAASDPSCDINKLERLMEMHERMQAHSAKQLYDEALAQMQEEMPVIGERGGIKDKNGRIQSTYALWEDINEMIKPVMAKYGFALTFRTPRNERGIEVEGVLSHRAG
ncbi:MAG: single-stranded DNA-binding protein, partial [Pseudomonas sp.]|nr:single-stranded DNA-binding protein [Pseudomonas sp.]